MQSSIGISSSHVSASFGAPSPVRAFATGIRSHVVHHSRGRSSLLVRHATEDSSAGVLAGVSLVALPVVFFSEFTLKSTGCGLPAGPFGLYGAVEGISYLWVVGLVGYSIYTKIKTGKGLPNGPYGLLGAAEGVSYLAILAGLAVLGFQISDYGYIPNAVPVQGGKCA